MTNVLPAEVASSTDNTPKKAANVFFYNVLGSTAAATLALGTIVPYNVARYVVSRNVEVQTIVSEIKGFRQIQMAQGDTIPQGNQFALKQEHTRKPVVTYTDKIKAAEQRLITAEVKAGLPSLLGLEVGILCAGAYLACSMFKTGKYQLFLANLGMASPEVREELSKEAAQMTGCYKERQPAPRLTA